MENVVGVSELTARELKDIDGGILLISIVVGYLLFKPGAMDNFVEGFKEGYGRTNLDN